MLIKGGGVLKALKYSWPPGKGPIEREGRVRSGIHERTPARDKKTER